MTTALPPKHNSLLTVQQFTDRFYPTLVGQIKNSIGLSLAAAQKVGELVIQKLKARFQPNNPQPIQVFQDAIVTIVSVETNKIKRLMDKNFGLTEDAFNEMVIRLQAGNEELYEKIFLTHFESCLFFVKRKYKASHQDAYDASMNAMLTFCRKLKAGSIQYGNLRFLFTQMAGQLYLKWIKRESRLEDFTHYDLPEELPSFDKESLLLLDKAFAQLGEGCSQLLNAFYYQEKSLQQIAESISKKPAAVRKQKQRCIEKLRTFFTKLS